MGKFNMIQQKPNLDLNTLVQLAERKSEYLTIIRTPVSWTVAGKDPQAAIPYESLSNALINFILTQIGNDSG